MICTYVQGWFPLRLTIHQASSPLINCLSKSNNPQKYTDNTMNHEGACGGSFFPIVFKKYHCSWSFGPGSVTVPDNCFNDHSSAEGWAAARWGLAHTREWTPGQSYAVCWREWWSRPKVSPSLCPEKQTDHKKQISHLDKLNIYSKIFSFLFSHVSQ